MIKLVWPPLDIKFHGSLIGALTPDDVCKLSHLHSNLIGQIANNFHFDQFAQFGYTKHARAFRTQIGLDIFFKFRPIWVRKARACLVYPNGYTRHRLKSLRKTKSS